MKTMIEMKQTIEKNIIPISVISLIGLVLFVAGGTYRYAVAEASQNARIEVLETEKAKGERFTESDAAFMEGKIDQQYKELKSDIRDDFDELKIEINKDTDRHDRKLNDILNAVTQ